MPKKTLRPKSRPARQKHARTRVTPSTEAFEKLAAKAEKGSKYELRLYVAGITPKSTQAIANVRQICEEHLAGRYKLEVVDLYQNPVLSRGEQIIAVPTLIKSLPMPLRKFIGDMSDTQRILVGLDLRPKGAKV